MRSGRLRMCLVIHQLLAMCFWNFLNSWWLLDNELTVNDRTPRILCESQFSMPRFGMKCVRCLTWVGFLWEHDYLAHQQYIKTSQRQTLACLICSHHVKLPELIITLLSSAYLTRLHLTFYACFNADVYDRWPWKRAILPYSIYTMC